MKDKLDNLKERIDNISNIIGENELVNEKDKNQLKTINDIISHIKFQMSGNNESALDALNKSK